MLFLKCSPSKPGSATLQGIRISASVDKVNPKILYGNGKNRTYMKEFGLSVHCNKTPVKLHPGNPDMLGRVLEWFFFYDIDGRTARFKIIFNSISQSSMTFVRYNSVANFELRFEQFEEAGKSDVWENFYIS